MVTAEKLEKELAEIGRRLSVEHYKVADSLAAGNPVDVAYRDGGYKPKSDESARVSCLRLRRTNPDVDLYVATAKRLAQRRAQEQLHYDELDWLETQLRILRISLGDEAHIVQGKKGSVEIKVTNLVAANKAQELLGRRYALFTDKTEVDTPEGSPLSNLLKEIARNAKEQGPIARD